MKIKSYLPHVVAVLLFTILSFAYFYPVIEGKVLKANDSMVAKINAKEISDFRAEYGEEPLWTNSLFSGMPAYLISTVYPGNLFRHIDKVLRIFGMPVAVVFLSMAGFYILLLMFGVNPWLAIVGAVGYGLSSFLFQIIAAGHNTQAVALAYLAPLIGGVWYAYRKDAIKGAIFTAFILALELLANHPQVTYYGFMIILVFLIIEFIYAIKEKVLIKFFRTSAIMIIPFIIGIGINFAFLYTTYEYGKYSMRGKSDLIIDSEYETSGLKKDYIVQWSYGVGETFNLLIPDFKGGSSHPFDRDSEIVRLLKQNGNTEAANMMGKYWGPQPSTEGPHYIGAVIIFLFVLGLVLIRGRDMWWLLIVTVLSIMLAWGRYFMPLSHLFIDYFPGYNKFRSVTFILIIAQITIPLLGMLALKEFYNSGIPKKKMIRGLLTALGVTGGVALLFLIIPSLAGSFLNEYEVDYPDIFKNALIADRKGLLRNDAFRSLIFILMAGGTLLAVVFEKIKKEYSVLIIGLLILIDLWSVDRRYLNADRFVRPSILQKSFSPSAADAFILKDPSDFRVWNRSVSTFNDNSPTSWFHKSIGGYHGAKLKRYQELIDSALGRDIFRFDSIASNVTSEAEVLKIFSKTPVLNMLNTKYVIYHPEAPPLLNEHALGNAWFVRKSLIAGNANEELSILNRINPKEEAVVDRLFSDQLTRDSYQVEPEDQIKLISYKANELIYSFSASGERMVVFSEIYYPAGWKCYVDGTESRYFRANYVLRGMEVPAGEHKIRFSFEPASYKTGNSISLASSILLIVLLAGYGAMKIFRNRPSEND
ncbi:MAG TPA: YfhO family protein [Bacteroidales bacterium]|nr:YfhO family protein [Bacteroidales bacterium]HPF01646.1 YfhO family protein [Bacteroidales bacterium]HPJ58655.1 YfhO family protein [Bacteroidales bacterium]HPR12342.1 YfhO family protein [Bacteroidales bacterium]HRW84562.1 YfhO family protein [Bacteroidales bacterium]